MTPGAGSREPVFNLPRVVLATILLLVAVHALRVLALPEDTDIELLIDLAVVPARWSVALGSATPEEVLRPFVGEEAGARQQIMETLARYVLEGGPRPWTALTYAGLHGSWTHVLLNSVWLAAFGTPVARRCGAGRFLVFAAASAVGGAVAHALTHPLDVGPMVGASAAVSGMMAAAAWFMFARPSWTLEGRLAEPHERRRESLASMVRNRSVLLFVGVWFATNYLFASVAQPLGLTDASIAWEAHVGGFLVGLALFPLLDPLQRLPLRRLS